MSEVQKDVKNASKIWQLLGNDILNKFLKKKKLTIEWNQK